MLFWRTGLICYYSLQAPTQQRQPEIYLGYTTTTLAVSPPSHLSFCLAKFCVKLLPWIIGLLQRVDSSIFMEEVLISIILGFLADLSGFDKELFDLVVSTHLKNMLVNLDHFPTNRVGKKTIWNHHPVFHLSLLIQFSRFMACHGLGFVLPPDKGAADGGLNLMVIDLAHGFIPIYISTRAWYIL